MRAAVQRRGRRSAALAIALFAILSPPLGRAHADELPRRTFNCGDEVKRSARLAADVGTPGSPCVLDGLIVRSGVTLDLAGRTIWGNGADNGVDIEAGLALGSKGVVMNGAVRGFERGVSVLFNEETRVTGIVAVDNDNGVTVSGSRHVVSSVVAIENASSGIVVSGDRATVSRSVSIANGDFGMRVIGDDVTLTKNVVTRNANGLSVVGDRPTVAANVAGANAGTGLHIDGGSKAVVERNNAVGNSGDGIWLEATAGGSVVKNRVIDNGEEGIQVNGGDAKVTNNVVSANAQDGIDSAGDDNIFKRNTTKGNVGSGIEIGGGGQRLVENNVTGNGASGIRFSTGGGELVDNRMIANGFPSGQVDRMDPGLDSTAATSGVTGSGNISRANDGVGCLPAVCEVRDSDLPEQSLDCGDPVIGSVRLASDVGSEGAPCEEDGLLVVQPDTTIDLNGHTIWGNGADDVGATEAGIRIHEDNNVRILDGRIEGFEMAVLTTGDARRTTVDGLVVSDSAFTGIQLAGRHGAIVDSAIVGNAVGVPDTTVAPGVLIQEAPATATGSLVAGNGQAGFRGAVGDGRIGDNVVTDNGAEGIVQAGIDVTTTVVGNVVIENGEAGISVGNGGSAIKKNIVVGNGVAAGAFPGIESEGSGATISGNVTSDNDGIGTRLLGTKSTLTKTLSVNDGAGGSAAIALGTPPSGAEVTKNTVLASVDDGMLVNARSVLVGNAVYASGDWGIWAGGTRVEIRSGRFIGNATGGMLLDNAATRAILEGNRVLGNGFETADEVGLGIDASGAGEVSGKNVAYGNDDPDDCEPASLC